MKATTAIRLLLLAAAMMLSAGQTKAQDNRDWAALSRYAKVNTEMKQRPRQERRVVFMGNSITEGWASVHPSFFTDNGFVGRGISGQTSYQFLVRFREDVISLTPEVVVINAGSNDVAENTGPYNEDYTFGNIVSMVELAQANGIKVVLTSLLPASGFGWNKSVTDVPLKISSLNERLRRYAKKNRIPYADYHSQMVSGAEGALNPDYTGDGVHPTPRGYDVMEAVIMKTLGKMLRL